MTTPDTRTQAEPQTDAGTPTDTEALSVASARQVGPYALQVTFVDGISRVIDFEPFLRGSRNPMIRVFLEPGRFSAYEVRDGDLVWGDYELIFPVADLYYREL